MTDHQQTCPHTKPVTHPTTPTHSPSPPPDVPHHLARLTDFNSTSDLLSFLHYACTALQATDDFTAYQQARLTDAAHALADLETTSVTEAVLFVDASSQHPETRPRRSSIGYIIQTPSGTPICREGACLARPNLTTMQAEFNALIAGLEAAHAANIDSIDIRSDAKSVIQQIRGTQTTSKDILLDYQTQVENLLTDFTDWTITHIPRRRNAADPLARAALPSSSSCD